MSILSSTNSGIKYCTYIGGLHQRIVDKASTLYRDYKNDNIFIVGKLHTSKLDYSCRLKQSPDIRNKHIYSFKFYLRADEIYEMINTSANEQEFVKQYEKRFREGLRNDMSGIREHAANSGITIDQFVIQHSAFGGYTSERKMEDYI